MFYIEGFECTHSHCSTLLGLYENNHVLYYVSEYKNRIKRKIDDMNMNLKSSNQVTSETKDSGVSEQTDTTPTATAATTSSITKKPWRVHTSTPTQVINKMYTDGNLNSLMKMYSAIFILASTPYTNSYTATLMANIFDKFIYSAIEDTNSYIDRLRCTILV